MPATTAERVRDNLLRRMAKRRGFKITRSRRKDHLAVDYGVYRLTRRRRVIGEARTLDELERLLSTASTATDAPDPRRAPAHQQS